jgi:PAS domain S-box-containing protein
VSDAVVLVDHGWRFRYVNPAAERILQRSADDLVGKEVSEAFPGWRDSPFHQGYLDAIERGQPLVVERYSEVLPGWFEVEARPRPDGLLLLAREVTARRQQQQIDRFNEAISAALEPIQGPTDLLRSVLRAFFRVLDADVAELWTRDHGAPGFRMVVAEHRLTDAAARFVQGSADLQLGDGSLIARASAQGEAVVVDDLSDPARFHRSELAESCGLRRAVTLPVGVAATPDAVLCFLGDASPALAGEFEVLRSLHGELVERIDRQRRLHDLQQLFSLSRDGMVVARLDGYFTRVNPGFAKMLGMSEEDILERPFLSLIHPDDREVSSTAVEQHHHGQHVEAFVNRYLTADGGYRITSWQSSPVPEDGVAYGVVRDVTEEHLDRAFEDAQREVLSAIVTSDDLEGTLDRIARALEARLGDGQVAVHLVEPELHRLVLAAAPSLEPDLAEGLAEFAIGEGAGACGTAAATGETVVVDDLTADVCGAVFRTLVETHGLGSCWSMPFAGSDGQVLGTVAVYRTGRRSPDGNELRVTGDLAHLLSLVVESLETRRQLVESEERFRLLAAATSDAIWDWDLLTDGLWWSEGLRHTFGYDPRSLATAAAWAERLHPEDRGRILADLTRAIDRGDQMWSSEHRILRADGTVAFVQDRGAILRDRRGRGLRMIGGMVDTTERRELEQQYLRAERMESVGTVASGVAHDLNNVLSPILLASDLLLGQDLAPTQRSTVETIRVSAHRGADMVRQVLTFARGLDGERSVTDLGSIVDEIQALAAESLFPDGDVEVEVAPGLRAVHADPTQLHQVLLNLVLNAIEAMPDGGRVTIRADNLDVEVAGPRHPAGLDPGRYVRLRVEDTGVGMSPEVAGRAFDPFFTTRPTGSSTGLGLATSLAIVRSHQGRIDVQSEPGVGSTFIVYLPASAESAVTEVLSEPEAVERGRGERILVVDDEASVRAVTQHALEAYGYRVETASDGIEALATFERRSAAVDLVIADIDMPLMDGVELIRRLREQRQDVRVVAVSGLSDDVRLARATDAGAVAGLRKPFDTQALLRTVARALAPRGEGDR